MKRGPKESKGSIIILLGISSKGVIVLSISHHLNGLKNVYHISMLFCVVA